LAIAEALVAGRRGDTQRMRTGLTDAARSAAAQRRPAEQCEALALLALETARASATDGDETLLGTAESAAREARQLCTDLAGHPLWGAQAAAASAEVALARGDAPLALEHARTALAELHAAQSEDPHLEILLPAARTVLAVSDDETEKLMVGTELRIIQGMTLQRTLDDEVRVRWLRGPVGSLLAELAGPMDLSAMNGADGAGSSMDAKDARLLRLLTEGMTNSEIATDLGVDESAVTNQLTALYARTGTSSRAEATAFAFRARV